ncbi:MAG: hypothetical protein M3527_08365 [Actinomycetota bacterium]|nr:hypothetical protein [Actinomycetota bacterium]
MRVLTDQDVLACPHGVPVSMLKAVRFKLGGHAALVSYGATGPTTKVEGCPADPPCTGAHADATASPLSEAGYHVVLDTSPTTAYQDDGTEVGPLVLTASPDGDLGGLVTLD